MTTYQEGRLPIYHPKVALATLVVLVSGIFNTLGQKFLMYDKYGGYRHPIFINLGMFFGEYFNLIIFMILTMIPSTFQKRMIERNKLVNKLIFIE